MYNEIRKALYNFVSGVVDPVPVYMGSVPKGNDPEWITLTFTATSSSASIGRTDIMINGILNVDLFSSIERRTTPPALIIEKLSNGLSKVLTRGNLKLLFSQVNIQYLGRDTADPSYERYYAQVRFTGMYST